MLAAYVRPFHAPRTEFSDITDFEHRICRERNAQMEKAFKKINRARRVDTPRYLVCLLTLPELGEINAQSWRFSRKSQWGALFSVHSGMVLVPKMSPKMLLHTGFWVRTCVLTREHSGKSRALFPFDQPSFRYTRNYVEAT